MVNGWALWLVVFPEAVVHATIRPSLDTVARLLAELVVSLELLTIGPNLLALAVLLAVDIVAFILASIAVSKLSESMLLVIAPGTVVDVSAGKDGPAAAVRFASLKVAFVNASFGRDTIAFAVSLVIGHIPLALVTSTAFQSHQRPMLLLHTRFVLLVFSGDSVLERRQSIPDFLHLGSQCRLGLLIEL